MSMKETFAVLNQMVADGAIENYASPARLGRSSTLSHF